MRKEANFEVTDRIEIGWTATTELDAAIEAMKSYIMTETLAQSLINDRLPEPFVGKDWEIEGINCSIMLKNISKH
jgi:isoleucyl-tRNA synthetase